MKRFLKVSIGFIVSAILIIYVVSQIQWEVVSIELKNAKLFPIFLTTILWVVHFILRAFRWQFLLPKDAKTSLGIRFESIMIGVFATFLLPLRAGEFIRPMFLARFSDVNFASGFVSVFIERFFDLVCVLSMFAIVTLYVPGLPEWASRGAFVFGVLASCIFVFITLCAAIPNSITGLTNFICRYLPSFLSSAIKKIVSDVINGANSIGTVGRFISVIFLTATIWFVNVLTFYYFMEAVSLPLDFTVGFTLTVLVALAVAAPSAPGFIGVYQVAAIACFSLFGIGAEKATAYSLLSHVQQYILYCAIGMWILMKRGLTLAEFKRS